MPNRVSLLLVICGLALWTLPRPVQAGVVRGEEVPPGLAEAATTYANVLAAGNTTKAWELLSAKSRSELDAAVWYGAFQQRSPVAKPPAAALLKALATGEPAPDIGEALVRPGEAFIPVTGSVQITQNLVLVREEDAWRVDLAATDKLNTGQAAKNFLAAVREETGTPQMRRPRQLAEPSLPLLRMMFGPEAKNYQVLEADLSGDRAEVTVAAEVPVNLVLRAARSGAGWRVELARPVVPIDPATQNPLEEAAAYADKSTCEDQLRQLARGIQMYAASSDDMLPDPARWLDQIRRYLPPGFVPHCPRDTREGISYAFNANLAGKRIREVANPGQVPMLFESKLRTRNPADTGQSWAELRHSGGNLVAFVDGSVRLVLGPPSFAVSTAPPGAGRPSLPRRTMPPRDRRGRAP